VLSSQAHEREGDATLVPHLLVEFQRLTMQHDGMVEIGAIKRERARLAQELRPRGRLDAVAFAQCSFQPAAALQEAGPHLLKACQRPGQPKGRLGFSLKRP
jgi:hypothetical protein